MKTKTRLLLFIALIAIADVARTASVVSAPATERVLTIADLRQFSAINGMLAVMFLPYSFDGFVYFTGKKDQCDDLIVVLSAPVASTPATAQQ